MYVPVYIENPVDGDSTFDQIQAFSSTDSYASAVFTVDINTATRNQWGSGYTLKGYEATSGESLKFKYINNTQGIESELSDALLVGSSYAISQARIKLRDTDSSDYTFTDAEMQSMEQEIVNKLFPFLMAEEEYTGLTISQNVIDYDLPVGVFRITQCFRGSVADGDWREIDTFELLLGRKLRLPSNEADQDNEPLTVYYKRPFRNSGEVPMLLQPLLIDELLAECYEILSHERGAKFKAYAAQRRDSDVRPETMSALADKYRADAERRRKEIEKG